MVTLTFGVVVFMVSLLLITAIFEKFEITIF